MKIRFAKTVFAFATLAASFSLADSNALNGRWTSGRISTIQYRNAYTGVSRPPTGSYFSWNFKADGTYTFSGLLQSTLYSCTTSMFGEESGEYTVSGNTVHVKPQKNPYKMTNSCSPSSNREGPGKLTERDYQFTIDGSTLKLDSASGHGDWKLQRSTE